MGFIVPKMNFEYPERFLRLENRPSSDEIRISIMNSEFLTKRREMTSSLIANEPGLTKSRAEKYIDLHERAVIDMTLATNDPKEGKLYDWMLQKRKSLLCDNLHEKTCEILKEYSLFIKDRVMRHSDEYASIRSEFLPQYYHPDMIMVLLSS